MKEQITYSAFQKSDFDSLLKMGLKLWTDYGKMELSNELERVCSLNKQKILIAKNARDIAIGFSIFSIREDYVEGADSTPTGYLEGIYVESQFRKNGIAKRFMQIGEQWLKSKNCTQIGSNTWLTNLESRKFHKSLGFWEEDELVHFLKDLK